MDRRAFLAAVPVAVAARAAFPEPIVRAGDLLHFDLAPLILNGREADLRGCDECGARAVWWEFRNDALDTQAVSALVPLLARCDRHRPARA